MAAVAAVTANPTATPPVVGVTAVAAVTAVEGDTDCLGGAFVARTAANFGNAVFDATLTAYGSGYDQSGGATALYLHIFTVLIGGALFLPITSSFGPAPAPEEEYVEVDPTEEEGYY